MKRKTSLLILAVLVIVGLAFLVDMRCQGGPETVQILGKDARLVSACGEFGKKRGLSGQNLADFTKKADGMLFRFNPAGEQAFWMKDMKFPLDIIWAKNGVIVKIDKDIQAPVAGEEPKMVFSKPLDVDTVLELPAGGADKFGVAVGGGSSVASTRRFRACSTRSIRSVPFSAARWSAPIWIKSRPSRG